MSSAVFLYNIGLIILYTITTMGFALLYTRTHKRIQFVLTMLFFLFLADNTIVYMAEFLHSFSDFYNNSLADGSTYKMILQSAIGVCYLFVKCSITEEEKPSIQDWIVYGLYVTDMVLMPALTNFSGNIWMFYAGETFFVAYLCLTIRSILKNSDSVEWQNRYQHLKYFIRVTLILGILIILEDAFVLFGMDSLLAMSSRIRKRNLFEDVQSIVYAGYAFYLFVKMNRESEQKEKETEIRLQETPKLVPYHPISGMNLEKFSLEYSLTKREQEVLKLLLEDKTNQEMQEELVIALGTVKNHIHNIYQKTSVSKRSQLLMLVNEFYLENELVSQNIE